MAILISAFVLGLAGSLHCVGMCGPIVLALPLHGNTFIQKTYGGALYNLGRTTTYAIMGAIFGLVGQGLKLVGFQQVVSVIMGSLMIISVLFPGLFKMQYDLQKSSFKLVGKLKKTIADMFSVRTFKSLYIIGLLNGLLPCGLVYIAIAGAIATANFTMGVWYMILFGLGTIPMLLAIGLAGNMASVALRRKINRLIPVLVVLVGIFFILRGLNLNIKYLSPTKDRIEQRFEKSMQEQQVSSLHQPTQKQSSGIQVPSCCSNSTITENENKDIPGP